MAQTVEEIAEILKQMRLRSDSNIENLERALSEINLKLSVITDDEAVEVIKVYIAELKNLVEEKFNSSSLRVDNLEKILNEIIVSNTDLAKTTELRELFESFSVNFRNFLAETADRKAIIDKIAEKVETINTDSFGKDEIVSQIHKVSEELSSQINSIPLKILFDETDQKINDLQVLAQNLQKEFHQNASTSVENSLKLSDGLYEISNKLASMIDLLDNRAKTNYENLSGCINEIKLSFENNSKVNYENIINEINNLKSEIYSSFDSKFNDLDFENINSSLKDLSENVELLRDISAKKYQDIIDSILSQLHEISQETREKLNSDNELNFGELKTVIKDFVCEFDNVKSEFLKINDSNAFNISAGFSNVNTIFENLFAGINSLGENFDNVSKQNAQSILSGISDLNLGLEELKGEMNSSVFADKVVDSINSISVKIDELFEDDNYQEDIQKIKDALTVIKSEIELSKEEFSREVKENINIQSEQIKNISENVNGLKDYVSEIIVGLKDYISELDSAKSATNSDNADKTIQKLMDLEAFLIQNSQGFEAQFGNMQEKLLEFVHIVEAGNSDTEGKILSSLEEVTGIKEELLLVHDAIKNIKNSNDEKLSETISLLDAGVENIVFNINNINDSLKNGVDTSIKENILSVEEKFVELSDILNVLKIDLSDYDEKIINEINEKLLALKSEISLVNTDIADAIQSKADEIIKSFEPLRMSIDAFADVNVEKILSLVKSELEVSFDNLTEDLGKDLNLNSEIYSNIKQVYTETLNKVSAVEETVNNTLQNNIELLGISLESGLRNINSEIDKKFENQIDDLKAYLDVLSNDTKSQDLIVELKEQLFKTIENFKAEQENQLSKVDDLYANFSVLSDTIKSESENIINKCSNDEVKTLAEELKLDNTDIKESLEVVNTGVNKLSGVSNLLSVLNAKVDVLASDDFNENILSEIDEIKSIIFEQRKYFEEASDERAAAIDKYLRDVLLKLDNVDIEKSAEDVKEAVLNAVLSLSDQISFVEETEEIKNFVEEKTDNINKNIVEVHKQLKQLANGDNDFEYIYTLQDVESDIAKLRLAVNNISAGKFEDISDEIKRVVNSVENLESSLTQDQVIDLKNDIEKLNDDIVSISSRTNKLLLNSDESCKVLNDGLNSFSDLISKLEERINYLDNTEITERLEQKVDNIQSLCASSLNSNKIINQAMIYLGEWVDSTTQDISSISDTIASISEKVAPISEYNSELNDIKNLIEQIGELIPDNTKIIEELQNKFVMQEERIDNLERKLDKILSTLEEKDDMVLNRKVDKLEKMLSGLGASIEKLTSYVDEE